METVAIGYLRVSELLLRLDALCNYQTNKKATLDYSTNQAILLSVSFIQCDRAHEFENCIITNYL